MALGVHPMRSCAPVVAKASISGTCAVRARNVSSVRSIRSVRVVRVSVGKGIVAATVPLGDPSNGEGAHGKTTGSGLSTQTAMKTIDTAQEKPRYLIRAERKQKQQTQYLLAALAASSGITATAVVATVQRFTTHLDDGAAFPFLELFLSLLFTVGAAVGMEYYARIAHKSWWHESWMWALPDEWRTEWNKPFWKLHESHHEPREGAFEPNDLFAVANAVPAIALIVYGFFNSGVVPGICFGAGLGITIFGMAYMFVHDGMVHKRFPVGPIGDVPYLRKIAAAHKIHHSEYFDGVPYGLFLSIQELEEVGGIPELERMLTAAEDRQKASKQRVDKDEPASLISTSVDSL